MRKLVIVFMLGMVFIVNGCASKKLKAYTRENTTTSQLQLDYQSCTGRHFSVYIKDNVDQNKLEEDFNFCSQASEDRERHKKVVEGSLNAAALVPFAGVLAIIPGEVVRLSGSLSVQRCMESKGYKTTKESTMTPRECMQSKGYEWK